LVVPSALRTRSLETELGLTHSSLVVTLASLVDVIGGGASFTSGSGVAGGSTGGEIVFGFFSTDRRFPPHRIQYFRVGWFALPHLGQVLIDFASPSSESAKNTHIYTVKVFSDNKYIKFYSQGKLIFNVV
jgi:hypothetical protein